MFLAGMMENKRKYIKPILFLLIVFMSLIFFWHHYIELGTNEYNAYNEKGEKLNAIVIETEDLIRVRFPDIKNCNFITIVKEIEYLGVNIILPKEIFKNIFIFNRRAKEIGYTDGKKYITFAEDSIKFNTFNHYDMNLTILGDEIVIVRNRK